MLKPCRYCGCEFEAFRKAVVDVFPTVQGEGFWSGRRAVFLRMMFCNLYPPCCNPAHLTEGTHKENAADREARGRGNQPRGVRHKDAKLDEEKVREIRASTKSHTGLARRYGVAAQTITKVRLGQTWRDVK